MRQVVSDPTRPSDADTARAMSRLEREPLLPAEKYLVAGSLTLGLSLLGVLLWACKVYFPAE